VVQATPADGKPATGGLPSVREAVVAAGGVDVALSAVKAVAVAGPGSQGPAADGEDGEDGEDGRYAARCAGLLSRLMSVPAAQAALTQPDTFRALCKAIARTVHAAAAAAAAPSSSSSSSAAAAAAAASAETQKSIADEQSHLVRALATLVKVPEPCLAVAAEERLVHALVLLFPAPREELGEVTPESVTLPPRAPAPPLLLGNAARCLMPLADDLAGNAKLLYDVRASVSDPCAAPSGAAGATAAGTYVPLRSVERLICAMATCVDIRVRRNISILLAKGCRLPGVREHVEKYKGLQIMVRLQNEL